MRYKRYEWMIEKFFKCKLDSATEQFSFFCVCISACFFLISDYTRPIENKKDLLERASLFFDS